MRPVSFECRVDIQKAYEDEGSWIVEGFAATSDFDLQEDIITQQAIEASAKDLIENSTVLHNHNPDEAIGKVERSEAREGGLWLKIFISKTAPDIWQKITEGVLNKFSIRGKILDARKEWVAELKRYARMIFKMQLLEVSLVAVPANPKARALRWYIEKALDDYESDGGEIDEIEKQPETKGEIKMEEVEVYEEELVEASGDSGAESGAEESTGVLETEKADVPPEKRALLLIDKLIASEKDERRKAMLEEVRILLNKPAEKSCPCKQGGGGGGCSCGGGLEKAGRKMSVGRLSRLKKLLTDLQEFVAEAEPGRESEKKEDPEDGDLVKKLGTIEESMGKITRALGMAEPDGKDDGEPTLAGTIERLSKRLEAIEGIPAIKTSIDGQEPLAGEGKGKSMWKGMV
jgi:HK97 family phage prohead protease